MRVESSRNATEALPLTLAGTKCGGYKPAVWSRSVAQPGSAHRSGRWGRRFKSCHSDQKKQRLSCSPEACCAIGTPIFPSATILASVFEHCPSVVAITCREMAFELHHVMKNAANTNRVGGSMVKQEMKRALDNAVIGPRTVATVPQMIAADVVAKLGAGNTTCSHGIFSDVAQCDDQQPLVADTRNLTKIRFRVSQQLDDVFLGGGSKPIGRHGLTGQRFFGLPAVPSRS
jgi:hypothetical protein